MEKVFVITDKDGVVVDISTIKVNLSRGYTYPDYKLYEDVDVEDICIGDGFDGHTVTPNKTLRDEKVVNAQNELKVQQKIREIAIEQLKSEGTIPADYK